MAADARFTSEELKIAGFVGWLSFIEFDHRACPASAGVYVVTYKPLGSIAFSQRSCGGWFKGRDPSVEDRVLRANWVDHAEVIYIGKANSLRKRLRQYADFGMGKSVGHWGGRLIWQLQSIQSLRVAWKETPETDPADVEREMIDAFRTIYGKAPFANEPNRTSAR